MSNSAQSTQKKVKMAPQMDWKASLWDVQMELESYSLLLRSLSANDVDGNQLYGLGVVLQRNSATLAKVLDQSCLADSLNR